MPGICRCFMFQPIVTDSRRVGERCGFVLEGIHRHAQRAPDGALCDLDMFARLAVDQR